MDNQEIAQRFAELADLLEFKDENAFKIRAYRRVARLLKELSEDVTDLADAGTLQDLPGVGKATAKKIVEYIKTGKITRLEEAKEGVPEGILDVLRIQGVGPKKAAVMFEELGIGSVDELEEAAKAHKLRELPGMGEKSEENVLRGIRIARRGAERMLLSVALDAADRVIEHLESQPGLVSRITAAGSLRRRRETIGDVDLLACGDDAAAIIEAFTGGPYAADVLLAGDTKASVVTEQGPQVDLRVVDADQFGSALQYFTGSKDHNIKLRGIAKKRGLKISEYGLFKGESVVASKTEADVYRALGMDLIPPELREDRGEIEAAVDGSLPELIEPDDIRGDFHVHSDASDGRNTVAEIAEAAKARGYRFVAITDHSRSLKIAGGLTEDRVREQMQQIAALNKKRRGFRVLAGIEVDVKTDGSLDLPDDLLAELDVVIAAIHSGFKQPRRTITDRLAAAAENPHVDIIAHPTGRLIGQRDPYDVDVPELIRACARTSTALEINAHPERLDLTDVYCRMARAQGVMLAIGTDAHGVDGLGLVELGVSVARRGWLEASDVLNTQARPNFD
ncbi:MAG: DNA polymerase/3'-5' exonuclease PolX [Planctomycetota bacterium]